MRRTETQPAVEADHHTPARIFGMRQPITLELAEKIATNG
jgi:hypothetical protein